jgi:calpain-15
VGKPEPKDIKQGYLGDCYFLAGIAALSERPDRIFNLFLFQ